MCSIDDGVSFSASFTKETPLVRTCIRCGRPFYEYYLSRVYMDTCPNCVKEKEKLSSYEKEKMAHEAKSKSERCFQSVVNLSKAEIEEVVRDHFVKMGYNVSGVDFDGLVNGSNPSIKVSLILTNVAGSSLVCR